MVNSWLLGSGDVICLRASPRSPSQPQAPDSYSEPCPCPCLWHLCTHFPAPCAPDPLPLANMPGVAQVPSSPLPALHERERSCSVKNSGFPRALMDFWSVCKTHPTTQPTALQPGSPREPCLPPQLGPWVEGEGCTVSPGGRAIGPQTS